MARSDPQEKQEKMKRAHQSSLLSVENGQNVSLKKVVETKDRWVKVRVTIDTGAAGHVMPEAMFPNVKLERKTQPKKFVAANGDQIRDLGEKNIPFRTNEGVQRCITFRSANVVKPLISMQKVVRAGNVVVLDEKNPHIRNIRDGTVIKLDANNGVYTMDMWICLDETGAGFQLAGTVSGQAAFDKPVRPAELCKIEAKEENRTVREGETELNGIEEEQDLMSDEEGELAAPDWRVRAGPRSKPTQREREEHEATHVPFRDWCAYCMMGRGRTHHHVTKQKSED